MTACVTGESLIDSRPALLCWSTYEVTSGTLPTYGTWIDRHSALFQAKLLLLLVSGSGMRGNGNLSEEVCCTYQIQGWGKAWRGEADQLTIMLLGVPLPYPSLSKGSPSYFPIQYDVDRQLFPSSISSTI